MTREDIEKMEPGREMDALVAEKVMGWQMYHYDKDYKENCYYMLVDENFDAVANDSPFTLKNGERKTEEEAWKDNKLWSTDISAAWEVLEKMDSKGWDVMLLIRGGKHRVEIGIVADVERTTMPHAACIAALLAVMNL